MAKKVKPKNTEPTSDAFTLLVEKELTLEAVKEHKFHPTRRWRFDYAIPLFKIAIEVEGGVWTRGRHIQPSGFLKDMEKYNNASMLGWRILRVTPTELLSKSTIDMIKIIVEYERTR